MQALKERKKVGMTNAFKFLKIILLKSAQDVVQSVKSHFSTMDICILSVLPMLLVMRIFLADVLQS